MTTSNNPIFYLQGDDKYESKISLNWQWLQENPKVFKSYKSNYETFEWIEKEAQDYNKLSVKDLKVSESYPIIRWYEENMGDSESNSNNVISLLPYIEDSSSWRECDATIDSEERLLPPTKRVQLTKGVLSKKYVAIAAFIVITSNEGNKPIQYKITDMYIADPIQFKQNQIEIVSISQNPADNSVVVDSSESNGNDNNSEKNYHVIELPESVNPEEPFTIPIFIRAGADINIKDNFKIQFFNQNSDDVQAKTPSGYEKNEYEINDITYTAQPMIAKGHIGQLILENRKDNLGGRNVSLYFTTNPVYVPTQN